jgi:hypothetical protein
MMMARDDSLSWWCRPRRYQSENWAKTCEAKRPEIVAGKFGSTLPNHLTANAKNAQKKAREYPARKPL